MDLRIIFLASYEAILSIAFGLLTIFLVNKILNWTLLKTDTENSLVEGNIAMGIFAGTLVVCNLMLVQPSILPSINTLQTMLVGKESISFGLLLVSFGFFLFFMSAFILSTIVLASLGLDIPSAIGAAASAMGNIGPGLGDFGPTDNYALLSPPGKWILTFCMLLGRLEIFTVMVLFSRTFWK